ncbi:conserved hypothetical protein [Hyphomicrobiales bacterium]|nr:conserved hypothetical protein [Hyphomicrobiales bacterium]CAH1700414.1 hypothetical protein BOSEA1005_20113 [Hyphomicrobiales bacterium]CAI0344294.1 conserved hypothetical protein [Hyphomicrobiales bacterium]
MTDMANRQQSHAAIATSNASRYLQQLCKHFAHKVEASFDERVGIVRFSIGDCRLLAEDAVLRLALDAPDAEKLVQLRDVVESHLVRFAFRETLSINWLPGGGGAGTLRSP